MQGLSGIEEEMMNYVSVVGDGGGVSGKDREINLNEDRALTDL